MEAGKEVAVENPPDKSSESIIQISSIIIELPLAQPVAMNGDGCSSHNFSIRGFAFAKRSSNQNISSLFPSHGDTNDEELPPMEIPNHRYWRCSECLERSGLQLAHTAEINEGVQCDCTNAVIEQVQTPRTTEDIQSIDTTLGILLGQASEEIKSIGTSAGIQQTPIAQGAEGVQSIGSVLGKRKGPAAQITEGIRSIDINATANPQKVGCSTPSPSTQTIATAKTVDVTSTGGKNEPTERVKYGLKKTRDKGRKAKPGRAITGGDTEIPAAKVNTSSGGTSTRSEPHKSRSKNKQTVRAEKAKVTSVEHTANGIHGETGETESDNDWDDENSSGTPPRKNRKVRLMIDLLGEKNDPKVNTTAERDSSSSPLVESAGPGNAIMEVQSVPENNVANGVQSPKKKAKANQEDEETNDPSKTASTVKATKKDTGKAAMIIDVSDDDDADMVPSGGGEGLFIGTKTERLRRRNEIIPILRKKNKQTEMLEFSASPLSLPESSAARSWGTPPSSEQIDRNQTGLLSGAFKCQPSYSKSAKEGSDMSLSCFTRRNHYQGSGSNGFLTKDGVVFGETNMMKPASVLDRSCSQGQSLDLNERASLVPYNLEKNKIPAQREMDFFPFGLKEKSYDQGNPKRSDQRADDIPMDIVELLAKKQYEKKTSNTGNIQRSSNVTRRFSDGEMMGTVTRGYVGQPSFPATNAQLGASVSSANARTHAGNYLSFSQLSRNHLNFVHSQEKFKSSFASSPLNQQKPSSSGIQIPPAASVRGIHYGEVLEPLLTSTSRKLAAFGIQQKKSEHHKGITISDIKADEIKKTEEARLSFMKPGGSVVGSKTKGPLDNYGNESIPAMQLLSLMNGGSSGAGFSIGSSKILDKSFSPCSYHPKFSRDERKDILNGSLFPPQSSPDDPFRSRPTLSASFQSLRPRSASAALSSHFAPFITPDKEMSRGQFQNSGSSSGGGPSSSNDSDKQMVIFNGSNMMVLPPRHQKPTDSSRMMLEPIGIPGGARQGRGYSADGVCRTNRNPAEFSIPEAGNMYTICGRELASRKRKPYTRRCPTLVVVEDAKRQRTKKDKPAK